MKHFRKDTIRRKIVDSYYVKRIYRKQTLNDHRLPEEFRMEAKRSLILEGPARNQSITRVRNRCVDTGNPRFVIQWYRRSGLRVREMARSGLLPGVYKISW
jgi:ribosomal protein S14